MSQSHSSHQSLQWARPLIDELLLEITQAIEAWSEGGTDRSPSDLDQAIDASLKIAGTLSVLEFESGELIGNAMAEALEAIRRDDFGREDEALNALVEASTLLPDYLDYLESTQHDAPAVLLPTINELRSAVGARPLDESQFFQPPLAHVVLPDGRDGRPAAELRRRYQQALPGFLVNHKDHAALDGLTQTGLALRDNATLPVSVRRTGWAAAALSAALRDGEIEAGKAISRLYARLDALLKTQAQGEPHIDEAADQLCRSFLFHLAAVRPTNDLANEAWQAFDLATHAPETASQARVFLAGRNRALFAAVTQAAREDLAQIKDSLGSQLERSSADPNVLDRQTELLESVSQSLAMLGLDNLARRIHSQADRLSELGSNPDDPALLSVARELLVAESQLESGLDMLGDEARADDDDADPAGAILLPPSEWRRVLKQMFHEAGEDLTHAKSLLDALNRGKVEGDAAVEAAELLDRIAKVLSMASLDDGSRLLAAAARLVNVQFLERDQADPDELETLAEALTVAEFYFDAQTRLDEKGRSYFASTRSTLETLGYWPGAEPAIDAGVAAEASPDETSFDDAPPLTQAPSASEPEANDGPAFGFEADRDFEFDDSLDFNFATDIDEQPTERADAETAEPTFDIVPEPADSQPESAPEPIDDAAAALSAFDDFDIVEIFLEEFDHELESLQDSLPRWLEDVGNTELMTNIRRSFHSLKGSGRMAGAEEVGEFAWQLETLMNRVLDGQLSADEDLVDLISSGVDMLPSLRARLRGEAGAEYDEATCAEMAARIERVASGDESAVTAGPDGPAELEGLDPTLIELMVKELSENLEHLDSWVDQTLIADMPVGVDDRLVRAVHTMKGTMRLAPIGSENDTAQILEQYLEELAHSGEPPDRAGLVAIIDCQQLFHQRLDRLQGKAIEDEAFESVELAAELRRLHGKAYRDRTEDSAGFVPDTDTDTPAFDFLSADEVFEFADEAEAEQAETETSDEFGREFEPQSAPERAADADDETVGAELEPDAESDLEFEPESELESELESEPEPELESELESEPEPELESELESGAEGELESEPEPVKEFYADLNEDLLEAFLEEAQEVLEHADESLHQWRDTPDDKGLITGLQRDLHTIKGSSRMVGLDAIGSVAHVMEELLEGIAAGLQRPTPERIDALEAGCDHLHTMVEAVENQQPMPELPSGGLFAERAEEEIEEADEILAEIEEEVESSAEPGDSRVTRTETLRVPSILVDDLVNFAGEISIFRSRLEEQINVFRNNVAEVDGTVLRLRDQLRKLEIETEAQILARYEREHGPTDETFDPLELDRYSTIQQLSRALGESVNDLTSLTGILDDATRQSETLLMQQSRVNTELQEGLMQARMVAFNTLLPRFRRVVRNAARELDKQAQLVVNIEGEGLLDRSVLDRITAPLEHLLRNSIAHGIETGATRLQAGKAEAGTIRIDVGRETTELVLRISDDGAGLDLDAIRRRGIEQGLLSEPDQASEAELAQLIFRPGFSTVREVTELAGRGIGMDVVASEVRQIGGSVRAHTEAGKGARFTIRIPLSLTVMQAIMVHVADRPFAIPLQAVRGVTRLMASEWQRQISSSDPHQVYAGQDYPLLELETQLGFELDDLPSGTLSLLMIEAGENRAALRVSELQGHREIVIKPVGPQISSITGILGGTVTGDGQVVPILDMGPIIRRAFEQNLLPGQVDDRSYLERGEEVKRTPLVLVVDDSITMRRVTGRVLEHRGLEVLTARDGIDAIEAMFDRIPDLILLDIEMPRMDGYELATHVRNDPRLKNVPMVMITSRSGEKHRQHAKQLGVNGYLTKPYQEADLVEEVFEKLRMPVPQG